MANNRLLRWAHSSNLQLPPTFLAPSLLTLTYTSTSGFSTSSPTAYPRQDKSKNRNVSAIHRSGLRKRWPLSVLKEELPRPVFQPDQHMKFEVSKDHGLWQFFNEKRTAMNTPEEYHAHGRAWTIDELRQKDWTDLHSLWWVCFKDLNRTLTSKHEWERTSAGYGEFEADERIKTTRETQKAIKNVLLERWYAWEDANKLWDAKLWDGFKGLDEEKAQERQQRKLEKKEWRKSSKNRDEAPLRTPTTFQRQARFKGS